MADGQFDIGEAFDALVGDTAPEPETATPEATQIAEAFDAIEAEAVARDEKGRFAPKELKDDAGPATEAIAEPVVQSVAEPISDTDTPAIDRPKHLSAKLAEHWDGLTPDVRSAIADREREVHDIISRTDGERHTGRSFNQTVAEYRDVIDQDGGGKGEVAVRNLLQTARMLRTGDAATKNQLVNQICAMYDIDLEQAYYQRQLPEVVKAQLEAQSAKAELAVYKASEAEVQNDEINQTITEFRAQNPLFDQVEETMTRLAMLGASNDLPTLYRLAIAADEKLSSANAQQATSVRLAAEEASRAAAQLDRSRRAAISPTSAPGTAKPPGSSVKLTTEEQVSLDYDRIMSAMD